MLSHAIAARQIESDLESDVHSLSALPTIAWQSDAVNVRYLYGDE